MNASRVYVLTQSNNGEGTMPDEAQMPPIRLSPLPMPSTWSARDYLLVGLLMACSLLAGAAGMWWHTDALERQRSEEAVPLGEATLTLPAEMQLRVGEPSEIQAQTRGKRVVWMSLNRELVLKPSGSKSVWAFATRPGTYALIAWTAVDGLPSTNASCKVIVEAEKP